MPLSNRREPLLALRRGSSHIKETPSSHARERLFVCSILFVANEAVLRYTSTCPLFICKHVFCEVFLPFWGRLRGAYLITIKPLGTS